MEGGCRNLQPLGYSGLLGRVDSYPLVNIQKAIEHGPVEIVDFPMKNGGSFHGKMLVHQAG